MNTVDNATACELSHTFPINQVALFDAFIDAATLKKIWGVSSIALDAKPGGQARASLIIGDENWDFTITYREIVPHERLRWDVHFDRFPSKETRISLSFKAAPAGSEVTVRMENFESVQERDANRLAWEGALKKLRESFSSLSSHASTLLLRELDGFAREVSLFPDDASLWTTTLGITNSAGNLTLHVAGNLRYFVGKVLGGEAYVRDREAEFGRLSGTRDELLAEIGKAAEVVRRTLSEFPESRLTQEFPESVMGMRLRTDLFLLHLCVHAAYHLGQMGYLRRIVTGESASSGPLPLKPLSF